jgi:hypothetical protein
MSVWWQVSHLNPKLTMATRVITRLLSGEHCLISNVSRYSNSKVLQTVSTLWWIWMWKYTAYRHMLFVCSKLNEVRANASKLLEDRMLPAMYECFSTMGKTVFLLSGMRLPFITTDSLLTWTDYRLSTKAWIVSSDYRHWAWIVCSRPSLTRKL